MPAPRDRYGTPRERPKAYRQIEHELKVIEELGFPGYFLVVWDIVGSARDNGICCQGRGSAANSAVCYALGITKVDAVRWDLLFETVPRPGPGRPAGHRPRHRVRPARGGHPVRLRETRPASDAAQVANVIAYRAALRGAGHGQGTGLLARPAGRVEQADRPVGHAGEVHGG